MYQAYFPFDPFGGGYNYLLAHIFQFIGASCMSLQNHVNDSFTASHLALLSGQVHLLGGRIAKIGHDPMKTKAQNNLELRQCIYDHKDLLSYRDILEEVSAIFMFFQIVLSSINMCLVMVYTVLFVKDPFTFFNYLTLAIGLIFEILPSCYYGTVMEEEFHKLGDALFACNWMEQDMEFKKNLRIFAEKASRTVYVTALLFRINNNSFVVAYKNTYSLFTILRNVK